MAETLHLELPNRVGGLEKLANGQATKLIIPTDLQKIATYTAAITETMSALKGDASTVTAPEDLWRKNPPSNEA